MNVTPTDRSACSAATNADVRRARGASRSDASQDGAGDTVVRRETFLRQTFLRQTFLRQTFLRRETVVRVIACGAHGYNVPVGCDIFRALAMWSIEVGSPVVGMRGVVSGSRVGGYQRSLCSDSSWSFWEWLPWWRFSSIDRGIKVGLPAMSSWTESRSVACLFLDLESTLTATALQYASRPVVILFDDLEIRSTAGEYGFALDVSATVAAVESVGSDDGIWVQLVDWFGRIRESTAVESVFSNDLERARQARSNTTPLRLRSEPREPSITFDGSALELDPGNAGREVDVARTMQAIGSRANLEPIVGSWRPIPTRVSRADSIGLFTSLSRHTGSGLILFHEGREEFISPQTYAGWLSAVTVDGKLDVDFAETDIYRTIEEAFFGYASGDLVVTYDLVDGSPQVVGISDTRTVCCDTEVVELVKSVALGETDGPIGLPLRRPTEDEQAASVASLGVTEAIASFTTFHRCCEGRVINIHRIADLTRGVVIWPGESFSVNDFVGKRTRANGFCRRRRDLSRPVRLGRWRRGIAIRDHTLQRRVLRWPRTDHIPEPFAVSRSVSIWSGGNTFVSGSGSRHLEPDTVRRADMADVRQHLAYGHPVFDDHVGCRRGRSIC